ncbi:ABC transporter ATP-binding protein [Micromonospora sp. M12]
MHGFLGPNGSGKSTTIRILLGCCAATPARPSSSALTRGATRSACTAGWRTCRATSTSGPTSPAGGHRPARSAARWPRSTSPRRPAAPLRSDPTRRCRTYSKGNRQKVAIVAAFSSPVELYVLDEPTSGLDPLMEAVFQDEIRRVKQAGATVLLSSHVLAEVEALCDRVSIIREGRTVESGTLAELRHLTRTAVTVETARPVSGLDALPGCTAYTRSTGVPTWRSTRPTSTSCSASSSGSASAPSPAPRRPWSSSSCATTATTRR